MNCIPGQDRAFWRVDFEDVARVHGGKPNRGLISGITSGPQAWKKIIKSSNDLQVKTNQRLRPKDIFFDKRDNVVVTFRFQNQDKNRLWISPVSPVWLFFFCLDIGIKSSQWIVKSSEQKVFFYQVIQKLMSHFANELGMSNFLTFFEKQQQRDHRLKRQQDKCQKCLDHGIHKMCVESVFILICIKS